MFQNDGETQPAALTARPVYYDTLIAFRVRILYHIHAGWPPYRTRECRCEKGLSFFILYGILMIQEGGNGDAGQRLYAAVHDNGCNR